MSIMSIKTVLAGAIMVLGFAINAPAMAEDAQKANAFAAFDAVAATDLDITRGMHTPDLEDLEGTLQAYMDGNSITIGDGVTMTNTIDNSFNSASGVVTIIQNVGSNVIIQTATNITINYN